MPIDPPKPGPACPFHRDESGAVAIVVALLATVLLGFVAFGVDVGAVYYHQRMLQTRADMVAVSAVHDIADPWRNANAALGGNDLAPGALSDLHRGYFTRSSDLPLAQRMAPAAQDAAMDNAVSVTLRRTVPLHFAGVVLNRDHLPLTARATAMQTRAAWFSLGSRLAAIGPGTLNRVLGAALGGTLALSALDYQALAATRISLLSYLDALALAADLTAGDYSEVLNGSVALPTLIEALIAASPPQVDMILHQVLAVTETTTITPGAALHLAGRNAELALAGLHPAITLSALDILWATAEVLNTGRIVQLDQLALDIPGVLAAQTTLRIGEPAQTSGWVVLGEPGAALHTAQTRLALNLNLSPTLLPGLFGGGITALALRLPLYLDLAGADATLRDVACRGGDTQAMAALFDTGQAGMGDTGGPYLAGLLLGHIPADRFAASAALRAQDAGYADFLDLRIVVPLPLLPDIVINLLRVQIRADATVGQPDRQSVLFTHGDLASDTARAWIGAQNLIGSGVGALLHPDRMSIRINPADAGLVGVLVAPLLNPLLANLPTAIAANLVSPVGLALERVLDDLGLAAAQADLHLHSANCEHVVLVR